MAYPGQPTPPQEIPNVDQGMDTGTSRRNSNQFGDANDPMLDANEIQTLEHGGYGGEQEYMEEPTTRQPGSPAMPVQGAYVNQTDMTDQTGDSSQSESTRQPSRRGQAQPNDESLTRDTEQDNR